MPTIDAQAVDLFGGRGAAVPARMDRRMSDGRGLSPAGARHVGTVRHYLEQRLGSLNANAVFRRVAEGLGLGADQLSWSEWPQILPHVKETVRIYTAEDVAQEIFRDLDRLSVSTSPPTAGPEPEPEHRIAIRQELDIVRARQLGRELSLRAGIRPVAAVGVATAISELARNMLLYARKGEVALSLAADGCLRVVAKDDGPGFDPELACAGHRSQTTRGMGKGLVGVGRLMDDVTIDSAPGRGTTVTAVKHP